MGAPRGHRALVAAVAAAALSLLLAEASSGGPGPPIRTIACSSLAGTGSYADPLRIGTVTRQTLIRGCAPLRSGAGFNVRYFLVGFARRPSRDAAVMTYYEPGGAGVSGVHPRVALGASTVRHSAEAMPYVDGRYRGFYLRLRGLGPGTYRLGAEKLSSPLGSIVTARFHIAIVP
jgi:hypothetical protein